MLPNIGSLAAGCCCDLVQLAAAIWDHRVVQSPNHLLARLRHLLQWTFDRHVIRHHLQLAPTRHATGALPHCGGVGGAAGGRGGGVGLGNP